jgi:hypothetical protein
MMGTARIFTPKTMLGMRGIVAMTQGFRTFHIRSKQHDALASIDPGTTTRINCTHGRTDSPRRGISGRFITGAHAGTSIERAIRSLCPMGGALILKEQIIFAALALFGAGIFYVFVLLIFSLEI